MNKWYAPLRGSFIYGAAPEIGTIVSLSSSNQDLQVPQWKRNLHTARGPTLMSWGSPCGTTDTQLQQLNSAQNNKRKQNTEGNIQLENLGYVQAGILPLFGDYGDTFQ